MAISLHTPRPRRSKYLFPKMGDALRVNEKFNFCWHTEAAAIHVRTDWNERELTPIDARHKTRGESS